MDAAEPRRSPTRALQGLLLAAVVLPLLILAGGGWLAWRTVEADAVRDLQRSLAVTAEQATKILDSQILVADRVQDLLDDDDAPAVLADEAGLRDRIAAMIARFPQITGVLVLDAAGHPVVSTASFPVDRQLDFSSRRFFIKLRALDGPVVIGPDLGGSVIGEPALIVARRRGMQPFDGVIVVAISPRTIEAFDRTLLDGSNAFLAALFCSDGTPLARYPAGPRDKVAEGYHALLDRIAQQPLAGLLRIHSAFDNVERLVAYRRLDAYPVYVAIGRRWSSVWTTWFGVMATHLVIGIPATAALILLILLALRRTRAQESALAALQTEVRRREIAEEALRQAQKMEAIGRLTGGIAHDFNNHLTVISSNVELLKRRLPRDAETLNRLAEAAMHGVQRAATLTHRLLAFSRQQPLDPEPLDAGRLVSGMSDLLRRTLGETIEIETVLSGGLWQVRIDAHQLENALLNLAVNARDAMPRGGKLTLETANAWLDEAYAAAHEEVKPGQYVMIAVSDSGTGMSAETLARAFEPFYTTKPIGQGTGLGLSMVYGFIKQSGGHVKIYSEPGRGSSVKLYLPRWVRQADRPPARPTAPSPVSAGETILVVEDDEAVRRASVAALQELGYSVLEAPDAMEGIRLLIDRGGIDLLFTDIGLPGGVDGRALADAARNASPGIKVLFTTGYTRHAMLHAGTLESGAHLLPKPFSLQQLGAKVREVLDAVPAPAHRKRNRRALIIKR